MIAPSAIIFCNNDLTVNVESMLVKQLYIDEVIDGYIFDARLEANASYLAQVKAAHQRLLVIRPFTELDNRTLADVVIFIKAGLASIEENKFGPPNQTYPVVNLTWSKLGIYD